MPFNVGNETRTCHTLPAGCHYAALHQNVVFILSILLCQSTRSSPLQDLLIRLTHISGMPTSILDLPMELILEIIHSDDSTDATVAYYLGMTCHRLHDICQVLVMERRQLPVLRALVSRRRLHIYKNSESGPIAMKDEELDDVKEIFQASFHKIEYVPVTLAIEEIASVHGLIFHANTVGHINIKLNPAVYMSSLAKKKVWHEALASLIRVSMASLTITGLPNGELGYYFTRILSIPKTPSSPVKDYFSIFSPLKVRFFGHKTRSGGIGTQPHPQVGAPERERLLNTGVYFGTPQGLKNFEVHSPLPFHREYFPHTLQVLNGGYLTKLSLWNTSLRMQDWGNILPLLFMPLLSEFIVGDSDIAFRDLSSFLLRHSSITHLDLSHSSPIGTIAAPTGFLPCLEVISGNPDYLLGLLICQRHFYPNLRSVTLTRHPLLRAIQHAALYYILRNLAVRKRRTIHLSIEFSNETSLTECFSRAKSEPCYLDCVKTLEIIRFGFRMSSEMCDSFISWVSVFLCVQELDLTQLVVPPDSEVWTLRIDALWDSCPELQLIIVGVKTYQRPLKAVSRRMRWDGIFVP